MILKMISVPMSLWRKWLRRRNGLVEFGGDVVWDGVWCRSIFCEWYPFQTYKSWGMSFTSRPLVLIDGMFLLSRKASASIKRRRYPLSTNIFCVGMWTFCCSSCSIKYLDFISRLLTNANQRIGRRNVMEITDHPFFLTGWTGGHSRIVSPRSSF